MEVLDDVDAANVLGFDGYMWEPEYSGSERLRWTLTNKIQYRRLKMTTTGANVISVLATRQIKMLLGLPRRSISPRRQMSRRLG